MAKYNFRVGMLLYCKNGETVRLKSFTDTQIQVLYKGKEYTREISVINEKLFFSRDCEIITPADSPKKVTPVQNQKRSNPMYEQEKHSSKGRDKVPTVNGTASKYNVSSIAGTTPSMYTVPIAGSVSFTNKSEEAWVKSCRNCKFQISGECSSWDLCDDYQQAYSAPKSETDYYPKYGDATMFKKKSRKK